MKRFIILLLIFTFMACGAVRILNRDNFYYFHDTAVSTDSILIGNIFGTLKAMYVQPTGTDTSYSISLYLDPPELGGVADANTILLTTISDCNAIAGNVYYVLPSLDPAANAYGGIPVCGEVYIKITDANSTTLTDIKVWLISD